MSLSLKQLYGKKLGASDGEIGHVKDFLFDYKKWVVRYLVADTGGWMAERLVLISPHAVGDLVQEGKVLSVNLTRKQIENCPSIEQDRPVSRHYEKQYYQYYGLQSYWAGGSAWGMEPIPLMVPGASIDEASEVEEERVDEPVESHLRSMKDITGYHIESIDGMIGHVDDFLMDGKSWEIRNLVIKTGGLFLGKELLLAPGAVERISADESKLVVNLTRDAIGGLPEFRA